MLASRNRLKNPKDFKRAKKDGTVFQSDSFGLVVYERGNKWPTRFGFVVSLKIAKESVLRNKIKRALSEAVRQSIIYIKPGFDCVFLAKPIIARKYTEEIMREVREILKKAGVL